MALTILTTIKYALIIIASIVGLTVMAIMTAMMGLYLILVWASWNDEYE